MPSLERDEPVPQCSRVREQPVPRREAADVGARARLDVVVKLEVLNAERGDEVVDGGVEVGHRGWMPQVKVPPSLLHHRRAVPLEEGLGGQAPATGESRPTDSGSIHRPGRIPASRIAAITRPSPPPKRVAPHAIPPPRSSSRCCQ